MKIEKNIFSLDHLPELSFDNLILAAQQGNIKEIKRILKAFPTLVDDQDKFGWTPLHHAVNSRHPKAVKTLLRYGANKKIKNDAGKTPLNLAKLCCPYTEKKEIKKLLKKQSIKQKTRSTKNKNEKIAKKKSPYLKKMIFGFSGSILFIYFLNRYIDHCKSKAPNE